MAEILLIAGAIGAFGWFCTGIVSKNQSSSLVRVLCLLGMLTETISAVSCIVLWKIEPQLTSHAAKERWEDLLYAWYLIPMGVTVLLLPCSIAAEYLRRSQIGYEAEKA